MKTESHKSYLSCKKCGKSTKAFLCLIILVLKFAQSTLVISNSKGLRDIHTSTYKVRRIEEKIIRTITFNK